MANVGLAPREVRLVILTRRPDPGRRVGGIGVTDRRRPCDSDHWRSAGPPSPAALGLITVLATITTIQRIVHVARADPAGSEHADHHEQHQR